MSELLMRGIGLALLSGILAELLKQFGWRGAPAVTALATLGVVSVFGDTLAGIVGQMLDLARLGNISRYAEAALKILAVGLLSGTVSDSLAELLGTVASRAVSLAGRLEILAICLPYLTEIIDMGMSLISSG